MGLFKNLFAAKKKEPVWNPEAEYITEITDEYIRVTHPRRQEEMIRWDEIDQIRLANIDEGPFLPDVWMVLSGNGKGCAIPHGSKGWEDVYNIVSKYPGFDFENVIKSASCTGNEVFEIWKK